jgi:hypothetical protein
MDDMIKYKTSKQITDELTLVEEGEQRSWGNLFLLLEAIEDSDYWLVEASSFTRWLGNNSRRLHTKPVMLWRNLAAGRFVRQISRRSQDMGIVIPSLEEMPDTVSPENVEILSKLARVMPEDIFVEYARKVFAGQIKRSELRRVWETYRPVLGGKTGRGRGVTLPRLNKEDPEQYRSMMEAATLDAFQTGGSAWTGIQPEIYKVFVHPPGLDLFAAVVLVKHRNCPLQFHGVRFLRSGSISESFEGALAYCDYLWVFGHAEPSAVPVRVSVDSLKVPDGIGILDARDGEVLVIRPAGAVRGSGGKRLDLASALLIRMLE